MRSSAISAAAWRSGRGRRRECFSGAYVLRACRRADDGKLRHRFKLNLPRIDGQEPDSEALIRTNALAAGVLALPGNAFLPGKGRRTGYVRASFSLLGEADVEEACRRLGNVVREARGE